MSFLVALLVRFLSRLVEEATVTLLWQGDQVLGSVTETQVAAVDGKRSRFVRHALNTDTMCRQGRQDKRDRLTSIIDTLCTVGDISGRIRMQHVAYLSDMFWISRSIPKGLASVTIVSIVSLAT
jgi:hypothetical protein